MKSTLPADHVSFSTLKPTVANVSFTCIITRREPLNLSLHSHSARLIAYLLVFRLQIVDQSGLATALQTHHQHFGLLLLRTADTHSGQSLTTKKKRNEPSNVTPFKSIEKYVD